MATIVIRDLPESAELDRKAMQAVAGGARNRARWSIAARAASQSMRILDFRTPRAAPATPLK